MRVRIPRTATLRSQMAMSWAKLIARVEGNVRTGWSFHGTFLRPGAWVTEDALWPTPEHPRPAILLECAGNPAPERGHRRNEQGNLMILWRYRMGAGEWQQLASCCLPGTAWVEHLRPVAFAALREIRGPQPVTSTRVIEDRVREFLDAQLRPLEPAEAERVLCAIHDDLARRVSNIESHLAVRAA